MSELRWHPLLREWVAVAAHRQGRPQMPEGWCPFCPGSGRVPERYDVLIYRNDFAAFEPEGEFSPETGLYKTTAARGVCDVVLYHPEHRMAPAQLPVEHWGKVVALWKRRSAELAAMRGVEYVHIFENTGAAIGVTMPHPHGQIYGFPFVPPLIQRELDGAAEFHRENDVCIFCRILAEEMADGQRVVASNSSFVAFVPFFARWPGEIQICPRRHFHGLAGMGGNEVADLAAMIKTVRMKYDNLYGFPMPLMMMVRESPVNGEHPYFHFHVDFCPIQRSATKLKYLAGVESGTGTFLNDTVAEEKARELRETEPREIIWDERKPLWRD